MEHITIAGTIADAGQPAEIETKNGRTNLTRALFQDSTGKSSVEPLGRACDESESGKSRKDRERVRFDLSG